MDEFRVKIDESEQKRVFRRLIKKFDKNFLKAANYLEITNSSLSKYKRGVTRYLPEKVLNKVYFFLGEVPISAPKLTLKGIRSNLIKKAHIRLAQKYGQDWHKELASRRDFNFISLKDFPDYVYIYLDNTYRHSLLQTASNLAGSNNKLSKLINVRPSTLHNWSKGEQKDYVTNKVGPSFIPLSKLKVLSDLLVKDNNFEFNLEKIESEIKQYRMRAGNPIQKPNFHIPESPEVIRILFHLLGDGYSGNNKDQGSYRNTSPALIAEFKKDLQIFGQVPTYEQTDSIKFPRLFPELLEKRYNVNFMTFKSRISKEIRQIPNKLLCQGIRAFADDEGTIYSSSVRISSANPSLLIGIGEILDHLKIKHNPLKKQLNKKATYGCTYYLDIFNLPLYQQLVGFTHPLKKEKLKNYCRTKRRRHRIKELKT